MDKFINFKLTESQGNLLLVYLAKINVSGITESKMYVDLYNTLEMQALEYNKNELLEESKPKEPQKTTQKLPLTNDKG